MVRGDGRDRLGLVHGGVEPGVVQVAGLHGRSFLWLLGRVVFGRQREHRFLYRYRVGAGFQPYRYGDYNRST